MSRFLTPAILLAALAEAALLAFPRHAANSDVSSWIQSVVIQYSIAHIPYLVALYWVFLISPRRRWLWIVALVLRAAVWNLEPILSDDLNRYAWEAATWQSGHSPYQLTPRQTGADPLLVPGPDASAVYGPTLQVLHFLSFALGNLKYSAACADLLLLGLLWWWVKRQQLPLWRWVAYAWSPLPVVEFWRQGHNDAWLVLLFFACVASQSSGWRGAAWTAWIFALFTKWWPGLWLPWLLRRAWSLPGALGFALALGFVCFFGAADLWRDRIRFTTGFLGGWQNHAFLYHLLSNKWQAVAILLTTALSFPWIRADSMRLALFGSTWLLAWSANIHPWYLTWFLPFAAVAAPRPLPWLLAAALSPLLYAPMMRWRSLGEWSDDPNAALTLWLTVCAYALFSEVRARTR